MPTITIIDVYHGVNRFLGTISGELVKHSFELILFTVVTYMIASEWTRARQEKERLQWLLWGFALLSFTKLVTTISLSFLVFGEAFSSRYFSYISLFDSTFEMLPLILIMIGFLQPVIASKWPLFPKRRLFIVIGLIISSGIFLFIFNRVGADPAISGMYRPGVLWFNLFKIGISVSAIFVIRYFWQDYLAVSRYYHNVIQAIAVYSITPLLQIINQIVYHNQSGELIVAAKPFPFISVLLFIRVIFLQLADKAALYDQLATAQAKYQHEKELSELKDDFISTVSHELKTPLTAIALWGSILGREKIGKINKKQKEACQIINSESWRLSQLINDVLDLSRLEKGKIAIRLEPTDLKNVCTVESLNPIASEKGIRILNQVPNGIIVDIDPERFKQVVYNLVSNAIKFTEAGGRVTVSASRQANEMLVTVTDNGIGIPADKLEGLFTKFYQVENHLTRKSGGTGLGLAISKQIVELHGGTISAESHICKGSRFTVRIPLITK